MSRTSGAMAAGQLKATPLCHRPSPLPLPPLAGLQSALDVGRRQEDRRFPAEPADELALRNPVDVAFELVEHFESRLPIECFSIGIEKLDQGFAGDEELDGSEIGRAGEADALAFGDPVAIAHLEPDAGNGHPGLPLRPVGSGKIIGQRRDAVSGEGRAGGTVDLDGMLHG
jgi:hypothetical protein